MVRATSLAAYEKIVENGLLGRMHTKAYRALAEHGPMTASELDMNLGGRRSDGGRRLSELRDMGVVREVSHRPCRITGNIAIEWDIIIDSLPRKIEKAVLSRPKLTQIQNAVKFMRELCDLAEKNNIPLPLDFVVVGRWLAWLGKCQAQE
jgi:hypothetical protein